MSSLLNKLTSKLRGGGCGSAKIIRNTEVVFNSDIQDIQIFITRFDSFVQTIYTKAAVAASQSEAQEIMMAIQWFIFQEEQIYKLIKNVEQVLKSYRLIISGILKLLKSCLIYIRTDSFKCLFILRTTASLSKVIFSFHVRVDQRFMNYDTQQQFLVICDELRQQMDLEKEDFIHTQLELYLYLIKTSFQMTPNDAQERDDILKGCLKGIFKLIFDIKPNTESFIQLFHGACLLYNKYAVKLLLLYEVYYLIDILQWEIINNFKYGSKHNLEEIIILIEKTHQILVKNSNNWKNHFLWIQMIGQILIYNPLITKHRLNLLEAKWKEQLKKGFLFQIIHSDDQALILLNQLTNTKLTQIHKLILRRAFKEWENLILLKDFLMNEKKDNINFTFGSYLNLELGSIEQENDRIQAVKKIQQFIDFIISNKLLALIQENDEGLEVLVENYKNFIQKNQYVNETIQQAANNLQVKKMILKFQEQIENTLKIIKIIRLRFSLRKQDFYMEQKKINEFKMFQQLRYIMRLIEQILSQTIQDINDQRNEPDKCMILQQEINLIQKELENLILKDQQFSFANKFNQRLIALPNAALNKKIFLEEAQFMFQLIEKTEKQVSELESQLLNKDNVIQYFQSLLNNLNCYYEHQIQQLQIYFNQLLFNFQTILILQYEIESVSLPERTKEIKQQYFQKLSFQCVHKQRLNILKFKLQLNVFKQCFQNILTIPSEEILKIQNDINLDRFLIDVLCIFKNTFCVFQSFLIQITKCLLENIPINKKIFQ